ncbi:hypothetical protein BHAOGJBA_4157 [Methylobacterium hispanicum]|uniref:Uncharacterized protein n=1 Tax=Methylobacterium hispanicum TaxID=270350 RepID=A0AAV4ZSP5_9HYPH|nr:hypothetical protein [Methylobacterium hispanicum]GJD90615.1 hypothetical protein BHAOGJBA_4157 [Methylobacterium hispanicum]
MNPLGNRIANWHHADGFRRDLTFEGGRTMIVVAASAYNAGGLIGSEYNGLVVIDADNGSVVLLNHLRSGSGSSGPTRAQRDEFERVSTMTDWRDFATWLKATPGYLGNVPDIDDPRPTPPSEHAIVLKAANAGTVPGLPGDDILPEDLRAAHDAASVPYVYPHRTRLDMAAFLAGHDTHGERYGGSHLAWNIKVGGADMSGKVENGEAEIDAGLDALWGKYAERHGERLFLDACRDGIRSYLDGEATTYPGTDQGDFVFGTQGRSGGWLVLEKWRGRDLGFGSRAEMVEALLEMKPDDLAALYAAVVCFDRDIQPELVFTHLVAQARAAVEEEEWATPEAAEAAAMELGLEGWSHPSRAPAPAAA